MFKGMIEEFEKNQGTGTIRREDGKQFSFHISSVMNIKENVLSEGAIVNFDIGKIFRELSAIYVLVQ